MSDQAWHTSLSQKQQENVLREDYLCLQVTEETDFIVFHMAGMNITSKKINEKLKIRR